MVEYALLLVAILLLAAAGFKHLGRQVRVSTDKSAAVF
jgi:Flp pilus assembly pilin Flp